jgi:hypothetical protein
LAVDPVLRISSTAFSQYGRRRLFGRLRTSRREERGRQYLGQLFLGAVQHLVLYGEAVAVPARDEGTVESLESLEFH